MKTSCTNCGGSGLNSDFSQCQYCNGTTQQGGDILI